MNNHQNAIFHQLDGLNLYAYVGNNPLKYRDPMGHFPLTNSAKLVILLIIPTVHIHNEICIKPFN
jgi:hypothetical protein